MDTAELFDVKIPAALTKKPKEASAIGHVFRIDIKGAGRWILDCKSLPPTCTPGSGGPNAKVDCTIRMDAADFETMASSKDPKSQVMPLFMAGKIVIEGNAMVAMKVGKVLDLIK